MAYQKGLNRAGFISHPRGGSQLRTQELPVGPSGQGPAHLPTAGPSQSPEEAE